MTQLNFWDSKINMAPTIKQLLPWVDLPAVPFVYPAALLLKLVRKAGVHRLPLCKKALFQVGVFPIRNHYYEPQYDMANPRRSFSEPRDLPGIEWNTDGQLALLDQLVYSHELVGDEANGSSPQRFDYDNGSFGSGDAEFLYQMIRLKKPRRIYEIGSGNSTRMAIKAVEANVADDTAYECEHVCVEPYEMPWLESTGVKVVREKVEDLGSGFFSSLGENDVLFIDSSHMIRPDGDVLFEYLELLPSLRPGVIVHVHDIFTPRNYLTRWLQDEVKFWNEQYLLEAFLSHNSSWKILGALNYLHHAYRDQLKIVCPCLSADREPGSFYIQKTS
ncbi:hypothetical protein Poly24_09450 [Rosistilla carotiformis]|uniref:Class I SAM-dependent methyltransferase n=1 Tax=Rosistilla carotiformis TaxID=2528017 RepID=A0A518JNX7_9BACT|nr:class I SAM-dependent methyltransferase [Rosistilla carotiformis]QDV67252.1 hypothetical protein Poly24_09450 [Rosistilla carotiformis]